jgi:hypothetical protein
MLTAIIQKNFKGGMNLLDEGFNLQNNEYGVAYNVRNRKTTLDPVSAPVEDTTLPGGKKQGIYIFDIYAIAFVAGRAYYKDVTTDSAWTMIEDFAMSPSEEYIYLQAVPASHFNYQRKLVNDNQISGTALDTGVLVTTISINATPTGAVVQDGVNPPWLILPDGTARLINNYSQWSTSDREYVPIMRQMCYKDGVLYGIAADGKTLLRSVSGRPLDFVIAVDKNGNKAGEADKTSHAVGFDNITYLGALPSGELLVATNKLFSPLSINYEKTIFAEPTFVNTKAFPVGVVNQFSFLLSFGDNGYTDAYFIDTDGMRSFNAASLDRNEGRNSIFASRLDSGLAEQQRESASCAINFQDYSLFSIRTIYADYNLVAVFDNKLGVWVGFDNYEGIGSIKQFALATQSTSPVLYAITDEDKLYRLFAAEVTSEASVTLPENTSGSASKQIRLDNLRPVFVGGTRAGTATAVEYSNGYAGPTVRETLKDILTDNCVLNFTYGSKQCWRSYVSLTWDTDARLAMVETSYETHDQMVPLQQAAKRYANP